MTEDPTLREYIEEGSDVWEDDDVIYMDTDADRITITLRNGQAFTLNRVQFNSTTSDESYLLGDSNNNGEFTFNLV